MTRTRRRRPAPKYLRRKDGTLRALPAGGRCAVCGAALERAVTFYTCSNPRCWNSPLVTPTDLSALTRRLIAARQRCPELIRE